MLKRPLRYAFDRIEGGFDAVFTPAANPLNQLGAMGWFFYWIVAATGIYLYIFFDSGVTQAYESVERLTHAQWYAGGVMRSFHRYASDALVVVMLLHLLREYAKDRFRGARWFTWFTGVPLLWFVYASGISGYWVVWDRFAQYIATATTEWLDALPLFGESIARNFLHDSTLSGRFFTLMVFIHIAVPLFMLFLMWIHIQRLSQPKVNPPRRLALGSLLMLLAVSFVKPALSQGPADLATVPASIDLDWFYFTVYPLLEHISGLGLWLVLAAGSLALAILPWAPPPRRQDVARVDLSNCNGCTRCFADCPFSAITMNPRSDGRPYEHEAVVDASLCVSCGICAGACPTATPYRRRSELVPGIELPDLPLAAVREQILAKSAALRGEPRILVVACADAPPVEDLAGPALATLRLPCQAALPPSFIDFVVSRRLVEGVYLAGCRAGDCRYRLGDRWTGERLAGRRDPQLRGRVPRERLMQCWLGRQGGAELEVTLAQFRARLAALGGGEARPSASAAEPRDAPSEIGNA